MHFYLIRKLVSFIAFFLNLILTLYLFFAAEKQEISPSSLEIGIGVNLLIFLLIFIIYLWKTNKQKDSLEDIKIKEAILVVGVSWIVMIAIGAIPYILKGVDLAGAIFESTSGFSTTGASIFNEVESLPTSLLLWRSATQWIGGMGIIVFFVSIVPSLKKAGPMLFRSEMPGPIKESFTPHIRDTSRFLWLAYLCLTLSLIFILKILGLSLFDSVNHAFTTISTGGFSIYNGSVGVFPSSIQWVICMFMLLGGTNFAIYILLFTSDRKKILKDVEWKWYFGFIFIISMVVSIWLFYKQDFIAIDALRIGFFTIVSLVTTTGFSNYDYELFPTAMQGILLLTFFTGGSAGSTSGGVKFYRLVLLYKTISQEIKKSISPNLISSIKVAGTILPNELVFRVFIFMSIYMGSVGLGTIIFIMTGIDFATAFSAAASCVGNVGPALGSVGPTESYSHFPSLAKFIASILMILGRLEFFTIITLFHHQFWKEN